MTVKGLDRLSWSRISAYAQCSLKWKFHYQDELPGAWTPSQLAFGIGFHKSAQEFLEARMVGETAALDGLLEVFTQSLDEQAAALPIHYGPKESRDSLIELAARMLEAWVAWKLEQPPVRILALEHVITFNLSPDLPPVLARVDVLEEHQHFVAVVDIKTSKGCMSDLDVEQKAGQLALYAAAVAPLAAEIGKPVRCALEVVTKQKTVQVERIYLDDIEPLARTIATTHQIVNGIRAGVFFPQRGWACLSCPYSRECRKWPGEAMTEGKKPDAANLQLRVALAAK